MTDVKCVLLTLFTLTTLTICLELGGKCGPNLEGKCVLVTNCSRAVALLAANKPHGLQRCGFSGIVEIVCCLYVTDNKANITSVRGPANLRISMRACNNFNNKLMIETHIIGGENATLGEFPHMAALGYEDDNSDNPSWSCGGSLVSDRFVLTAAHCLVTIENKTPIVVRLGKLDLFGNEDGVEALDVRVSDVIVHPEYNIALKQNDIGLLRLANPVNTSNHVKPACLYTKDDIPKRLEVSGWGVTNTGSTYRFLQKTALQPVDMKECNATISKELLSKPLFETQLCAMSNDSTPRDTCRGDSGGPIQYVTQKEEGNPSSNAFFLVGVTSYGRGCGGSLPSIYTRVSKYLDWIEENVWPQT